jgi:hypothetical protein
VVSPRPFAIVELAFVWPGSRGWCSIAIGSSRAASVS